MIYLTQTSCTLGHYIRHMFISHTTTHVQCVNYNTQIFQSVSFLLVYCLLLYIQLTISFLIGRKRTVNFRNQRLGRHLAADYTITHSLLTIIMSRTLKVTGNHVMSRAIMVMYDRGAWFLRVIMSSSRALCCLPSVKKQIHDFQVCFVDRARHQKSSWRQGLTNTKRSTKVAKELFADYVKEKKLREPEEKKDLAQTLKTFHVEARKKGFVQCITKRLSL